VGQNGSGAGAVSIGQEDQDRENRMEVRQRREDDGIGVPTESNPHVQVPGAQAPGEAVITSKSPPPADAEQEGIWHGRADDPEHPGQTRCGGLGGAGPAQP